MNFLFSTETAAPSLPWTDCTKFETHAAIVITVYFLAAWPACLRNWFATSSSKFTCSKTCIGDFGINWWHLLGFSPTNLSAGYVAGLQNALFCGLCRLSRMCSGIPGSYRVRVGFWIYVAIWYGLLVCVHRHTCSQTVTNGLTPGDYLFT